MTLPMDSSKPYDYLPHDFLNVKLDGYGVDEKRVILNTKSYD